MSEGVRVVLLSIGAGMVAGALFLSTLCVAHAIDAEATARQRRVETCRASMCPAGLTATWMNRDGLCVCVVRPEPK